MRTESELGLNYLECVREARMSFRFLKNPQRETTNQGNVARVIFRVVGVADRFSMVCGKVRAVGRSKHQPGVGNVKDAILFQAEIPLRRHLNRC